MITRAIPLILLILSVAGIIWFSQGLRVIDTMAMLACGLVAGASLAALAAGRKGRRA